MGEYDIALRHVTGRHAMDLVKGLAPDVPVESASWAETQLTTVERRMDKTLDLRSDGRRQLLHVELVAEPRSRLAFRMFEYASLLVISLKAAAKAGVEGPDALPPVKSVAVLLSGPAKAWPKFGELRTSWPDPEPWSGHRFQIEPVYQRTVDELMSRPGVFWLVFAPLAVDATPKSMRRVLEEMRRREPQDNERAELYTAMFLVAELNTWGHNLGEEIRKMIQDMEYERFIMQSRTLREAFEQGIAKGMEQGVERGIERGRRESIEEMLQGLLMRRLQRELTPAEQGVLSSRAAELSGKEACAVLELDADALQAWLFGPDAE